MSPKVGAVPADPELSRSPERPHLDAPASRPWTRVAFRVRRTGWSWLEGTLWAVAVASSLIVTLSWADRALFTARESRLLEESLAPKPEGPVAKPLLRASPAPGAAAVVAAVAPQRPFLARLEIPAIALSALVVDGVDAQTLRRAVGRIPSTSRPGEAGNVALAGHRDTDFRRLGELEPGDPLILRSADGEFRYEVDSIRIVTPERIDVLAPEDYPTLTLVTCYPFHYVGPAPLRYVVRAREVARPSRRTT
ncbi:MAG: class D sortase [Thermoanaerobaculia bacterium]